MPEEIKSEVEESVTEETEVETEDVYDEDDDAEWDAIKWGSDEDDDKTEDEDEEANTEPATKADQPDDSGEEKAGDEGSEQPAEDETQSEGEQDADQYLVLKHMDDEPRKVSKEEATVLAQKGLDYDRIREERDSLKANATRFAEMEKFLNEVKGSYATIEDMMDGVRAQMLTESDKNLTQEQALAKAKAMRAPAPAAEDKPQQNRAAVDDFIKAYPDVKAEDIPKSVWDETRRTGNLVAAYARYETQQLKDANKKLQEALDAEKQNAKNRERSAGSAKSAGAKSTKSLIQELWDEDD